MIIPFTAEKHQKEPKYDPGLSSIITWVFRKLVRLTLCLMAAAWLGAMVYGFTRQAPALNLMLISLLIAIMILLTGLVLLIVLLAIASASKLTGMIHRRKPPESPKNAADGSIMYPVNGKEQ